MGMLLGIFAIQQLAEDPSALHFLFGAIIIVAWSQIISYVARIVVEF